MSIQISISIISYNNPTLLFPCLDSIIKFHDVENYEIIVVAYMFTEENLLLLRKNYPSIVVIVNNKITGFSENNNLALNQAKGEYCLILNDDTVFTNNSIHILYESMEKNPEIAAVSPLILNFDDTIQSNGRDKFTLLTWILTVLRIKKKSFITSFDGPKLNETYGLPGACFLIKTELFRKIGFFDDYYFFSPEDIAVGTKLNKLGYKIFVNSHASVYHIYSITAKPLHSAILPTTLHGFYYYFRKESSILTEYFVRCFAFKLSLIKFVIWTFKKDSDRKKIMINAHKNILKYSFKNITPKDLFIKLYSQIKK